MKSFGDNIRKNRILRGYSQKKLGELLGFSARTISDWECGNTEPNILTIKKIANVLQVSIDELFDF